MKNTIGKKVLNVMSWIILLGVWGWSTYAYIRIVFILESEGNLFLGNAILALLLISAVVMNGRIKMITVKDQAIRKAMWKKTAIALFAGSGLIIGAYAIVWFAWRGERSVQESITKINIGIALICVLIIEHIFSKGMQKDAKHRPMLLLVSKALYPQEVYQLMKRPFFAKRAFPKIMYWDEDFMMAKNSIIKKYTKNLVTVSLHKQDETVQQVKDMLAVVVALGPLTEQMSLLIKKLEEKGTDTKRFIVNVDDLIAIGNSGRMTKGLAGRFDELISTKEHHELVKIKQEHMVIDPRLETALDKRIALVS